MVDVFISYPRKDRVRVEILRAKLEALGLTVFFDLDGIDSGDEFPAVIDREVKAAGVVLACWSKYAFTRPWVLRECRVGLNRGVLVAAALEQFDSLDIPTEFAGIHYTKLTDFTGSEPHEGWSATLRALERRLNRKLPIGAAIQTVRDAPFLPEMVVVQPGEFLMGSSSSEVETRSFEQPQHRVVLSNRFAIAKFPVTFEEWDYAVDVGGVNYRPPDEGWGRASRPVVNVSWHDAQEYVTWVRDVTRARYRLPSEAEWEYCCRAHTQTAFSFGNALRPGQANFLGSTQGEPPRTTPVGQYPPNAFGLYEMHGNVWEWCGDCWNQNHDQAPKDGAIRLDGDCERRVNRGGAYDYSPFYLRSAFRYSVAAGLRLPNLGFRILVDL